MRVREALALQASFWADPVPPNALLERVGLTRVAQSSYRSLSAGERARLALALALVGRPEVVVLDEPTASMDIEGRHETWRILRELRADGTAVLLTTHLLEEAGELADRVVVLHDGRAHDPGAGAATASRARGRLRLDAPATEAALTRLRAAGLDVAHDGNASYRLSAPSVDVLLVELGRWLPTSERRTVALRVGPEEAAAASVLADEADP
jgi:ABC-2 type transport system ATP-binding protein